MNAMRLLIRHLLFTALVVAWALATSLSARADLRIDINQGEPNPLPIAITDFQGSTAQAGDLGAQMSSVIAADLERSGLFRPIDKAAFIQTGAQLQACAPLRRLARDQCSGAGDRRA